MTKLKVALIASCLSGLIGTAYAVTDVLGTGIGDTVSPLPSTTYDTESPTLGGSIIIDDLQDIRCWVGSAWETIGSLQVRVVQTDGSGPLDYYFRATLDSGYVLVSTTSRFPATTSNNVGWRYDGLEGNAPSSAHRVHLTSGGVTYPAVQFLFSSWSDVSSRFYLIRSGSTAWNGSGFTTFTITQGGTALSCDSVPSYFPN